jgi:hypothetical protein
MVSQIGKTADDKMTIVNYGATARTILCGAKISTPMVCESI